MQEPRTAPEITGCGPRRRASGSGRVLRKRPARPREVARFPVRIALQIDAKYEQAINDRLDRIDDYLEQLQEQGDRSDT